MNYVFEGNDTGGYFKILKAKYIADMLKGFYKEEILDLFDYYVGLSNMKNENIQNIFIYSLKTDEK